MPMTSHLNAPSSGPFSAGSPASPAASPAARLRRPAWFSRDPRWMHTPGRSPLHPGRRVAAPIHDEIGLYAPAGLQCRLPGRSDSFDAADIASTRGIGTSFSSRRRFSTPSWARCCLTAVSVLYDFNPYLLPAARCRHHR